MTLVLVHSLRISDRGLIILREKMMSYDWSSSPSPKLLLLTRGCLSSKNGPQKMTTSGLEERICLNNSLRGAKFKSSLVVYGPEDINKDNSLLFFFKPFLLASGAPSLMILSKTSLLPLGFVPLIPIICPGKRLYSFN
uniref:Uncharacterized protein n=1 Tax=Lepeophtheirus salmonis TaxID=72036 RepID=A0A0K2TF35_LEPSM